MFRLVLPVFFLLFMAACGPSDDVVIVNTYTDSGSEAELDVGDAVDKGSDDTDDMNLESDVDENDVDVDVEESDVDVVEPPPPSTCPRVRIAVGAGIALNVRPQANTNGAQVSKVYRGMVLAVLSTTNTGQAVNGNTKWYEIDAFGTHGFITAEYAECTSDRLTKLAPPKEFYLPLKCKTSSRITQGNNGGFSHTGLYKYSWDFGIPIGTPLVAMADGLVLHTYAGTAKGSSCDGGGASCQPYANHVVLLHGDETTSTYRHLSRVDVSVGDFVPRGVAIGLSGKTGYSTGPHAHVQRMTNCGSAFPPTAAVCQSIATSFKDFPRNGGVPRTGDTVTSANCIAP